MTRTRWIIFMLALSLCCAWQVRADTPLPPPRITGPTQVNNRGPLLLHFTYPPQHWSYQSYWTLWYWTEYWYCRPGKDEPPTPINLQSGPWPGQVNPCHKEENYYMGLDPNSSGESIQVPRQGGIPDTGTWYVRVRLVWKADHHPNIQPELGPWSSWHRISVVPSFRDASAPPRVLAPQDKHVFVNKGAQVQVMAMRRHPIPSRWEYFFEWQRADYYTKADNAYANPHPKPSDFPRVLGLASPYRAWTTNLPVQTMTESATPSTMTLDFAGVRPNRHDQSYIYRFRVRERVRAGKSAGPWSDWHSFIVTEPVVLRPMPHRTLRVIRH